MHSRPQVADQVEPNAILAGGRCRPGDMFFLATDAFAEWFLRQVEVGRDPCPLLTKLVNAPASESAFRDLIEKLRDNDQLRNDDVTLLVVTRTAPK